MLGIVSEVSNERASYVLEEMPLKVAFSFEHYFYIKNGYKCRVLAYQQSLEDMLMAL
jgi:hypothetical protein